MDQIDKNIILTDAQHGFRKRRACESQPIITTNDIASKLKRNIKVDIILQDIAIAFDEMENYGVNPKTKKWISFFLHIRKQRILEGAVTTKLPVLSAQSLDHKCFWLTFNDMPETASTSETKLFVDDSLLFRTITNQADRELLQKHWKNGKTIGR
ncbi:Hypothetical predicted protein [Mytilus galloprovincialis]|uniref:Reverse transcriptase domain-containing protein n=1 Tax=Mytilus galloprovincialis TaxID=29158 RepID=A0A8B6BL06_MYTGA|nr:Hypothetical predicted protein [Mytilus galloprovincialis]